jgi:hypothetical protein
MGDFAALVASPRFLLAVMAAVVLEAGALIVWHRRTGRGPRPALVCSLLDAPSVAFLLALTSALVFHVWHLALLARR